MHDHKGAGVNAIRTQTLIRDADLVIVRFGDKYRQWNAALDAGFAAALGKPIVTLHDAELDHALKEVDRAALAFELHQISGLAGRKFDAVQAVASMYPEHVLGTLRHSSF